METILAIDLDKRNSVFCKLNTSSLKPEYFTVKTDPQKFHDIFVEIDVVKLAKQIKKLLTTVDKPLRIAVMGCIVNGHGESADADLALCAAKGKAFIYRHGRKIATVPEKKFFQAMKKELKKL